MKYVSFTFDDGRRDNFTCAYAARNFAHLYVVGGRQHSDVAKRQRKFKNTEGNKRGWCFSKRFAGA